MAETGSLIPGDEGVVALDTLSMPPSSDPPKSIDEARAFARERFKQRLDAGEQVGNCDCHSDAAEAKLVGTGPIVQVCGIRFLDSGQTFYFDPRGLELKIGDWVVVETSRGKEAGRVAIAPHQIRTSQLKGEPKPVIRRMDGRDVQRMESMKGEAAKAVRLFGQKIRERNMPMKPISAEYTFDGSAVTLNFSAPDRVDFRELARDLGAALRCRVELKHVGARDETRLLGGVGRCGRTLCCASWLPVYPDVSMGMAKTQDLPLNPQKVSGVCGRLLCCLSYENEQYRQMKAIMPRLGQPVQTPAGTGMVVAMQVLKELITVRLDADRTDVVYQAHELGFGTPPEPTLMPIVIKPAPAVAADPVAAPAPTKAPSSRPARPERPERPRPAPAVVAAPVVDADADGEGDDDGPDDDETPAADGSAPKTGRRRRRRRGGRKKPPAEPQA